VALCRTEEGRVKTFAKKSGYHAAVPRILRGATSGASAGDSPMSEIFPHRLTRAGGDQSVDSALNCGWGRARDIRIFGPGGGAAVAPAEMENQFGARMVVFRARSSCARRRTVGPSASRRRARRLRCTPAVPLHRWGVPGRHGGGGVGRSGQAPAPPGTSSSSPHGARAIMRKQPEHRSRCAREDRALATADQRAS